MTAAPFAELTLDPFDNAELVRRRDLLTASGSALTADALEQLEQLHRIGTAELPRHRLPAELSERLFAQVSRMSDRRAAEIELAAYMARHPDPLIQQAAEDKYLCHKDGEIFVELDDRGEVRGDARVQFRFEHHCRERRTCPHESMIASKEFSEQVVPAMQLLKFAAAGSSVQYWVCSPPNVPLGNLNDAMREHARELGRELSRMCKREELLGAFVVCEYPLAKDRQSWNVHYNVLAITRTRWSARWADVRRRLGWHCWFTDERAMIKRTAASLRRQGRDIDPLTRRELSLGRILERAMLEVVKYSAKMTGAADKRRRPLEDPDATDEELLELEDAPPLTCYQPEAFSEWWYAGKGFRRARTYGLLNAQRKLNHRDFSRWHRLQPFREWVFDASPRVQGARIRAARERLDMSCEELAARTARATGSQPFRWLIRLRRLEPGSKTTDASASVALSDAEAKALGAVLETPPEALTRLQGASVPDIVRRMADKPPWLAEARAGIVRWHRGEQRHHALFLIQAAKSTGQPPPGVGHGPRAPPRGSGPPLRGGSRDAAAGKSAANFTVDYSDPSGQWA